MSKKVTVYSPDGTAELHTVPNARDLVNGAGYGWTPHGDTNPASNAPLSVRPKTKPVKSLAQEVLDNVGTRAGQDPVAEPVVGEEADEEEIDAPADDEAV